MDTDIEASRGRSGGCHIKNRESEPQDHGAQNRGFMDTRTTKIQKASSLMADLTFDRHFDRLIPKVEGVAAFEDTARYPSMLL